MFLHDKHFTNAGLNSLPLLTHTHTPIDTLYSLKAHTVVSLFSVLCIMSYYDSPCHLHSSPSPHFVETQSLLTIFYTFFPVLTQPVSATESISMTLVGSSLQVNLSIPVLPLVLTDLYMLYCGRF